MIEKMLSPEEFGKIFPNCKDPEGWISAMTEVFPESGITTAPRIASFIAQCGHESGGWRVFSENLNYSGKSLNVVFPKYFRMVGRSVDDYARNPRKIANVVYASRMGNGNIDSGDGWKFRGRGPIQLTGKNNYEKFGEDSGINVLDDPSLVEKDKRISLLSAIWFWSKNSLNDYADSGDIRGQTRRINGGYHGLGERVSYYKEIINLFSETTNLQDSGDSEPEGSPEYKGGVLKLGSGGDSVKIIQEILGLSVDGVFGHGTETGVKAWQKGHNLIADGIIGPKTLGKMIK